MKLPKSIIKQYGITKKAWDVFRGKKKKSRTAKKHTKRVKRAAPKRRRRVVVARTVEVEKMAVKRHAKRRKAMPKKRHHKSGRRSKSSVGSRPGQIVAMAATAAAGGIATSMVVNKTPVIRDQSRVVKSLVQGGLGIFAIMFVRNKMVKSLGAGAVIAAAMGAAQDLLKVQALAGPSAGSRTLTPSEMLRITGGMGIPLPGSMGVPMSSAPANAGFQRNGFGS
jgi:hypothetical protein